MQGQGIQSLAPMGGPQQKPMGGSMGGLGSVEDRVAAFRGRPEQLQQKYAMSQDLLDLLALQKIKSEKESAARQMQLAMNQQAMQNGQMPTVAQQREQEVHQLTKNELAQQRAATDQQKQQEEQEAIRQLASSGIATAPGANTVGMAYGGIIGFDGKDPDYGSEVPYIPEADDSMLVNASDTSPFGRWWESKKTPPDYVDTTEGRAVYNKVRQHYEPRSGLGGAFVNQSDADYKKAKHIMENLEGLTPQELQALAREIPDTPPSGKPKPAGTPTENPFEKPGYKVEQLTPPAAPPQARPPAPVGGGIGKPPKLPERTDDGGLAKLLRDQMAVDPAAVGRTARDEAAAFMKPTAEQEDLYRKGITEREQAYNAQFNPENTKWDAINAWLLGAGGRRWNVLGGAGEAAVEHNKDTLAAQNKARNELQAARQGLVALQRDHLKDAVGAGTHAAQTAGTQAAHAMSAAANVFHTVESGRQSDVRNQVDIYNTQVQAQAQRDIAAAHREVAESNREATAEARKEATNQRLLAAYENAQQNLYKIFSSKPVVNKYESGIKLTTEEQAIYNELSKQYVTMRDNLAAAYGKGGPRVVSVTPPQ